MVHPVYYFENISILLEGKRLLKYLPCVGLCIFLRRLLHLIIRTIWFYCCGTLWCVYGHGVGFGFSLSTWFQIWCLHFEHAVDLQKQAMHGLEWHLRLAASQLNNPVRFYCSELSSCQLTPYSLLECELRQKTWWYAITFCLSISTPGLFFVDNVPSCGYTNDCGNWLYLNTRQCLWMDTVNVKRIRKAIQLCIARLHIT